MRIWGSASSASDRAITTWQPGTPPSSLQRLIAHIRTHIHTETDRVSLNAHSAPFHAPQAPWDSPSARSSTFPSLYGSRRVPSRTKAESRPQNDGQHQHHQPQHKLFIHTTNTSAATNRVDYRGLGFWGWGGHPSRPPGLPFPRMPRMQRHYRAHGTEQQPGTQS